jgi:hypothetical protein
MDHDSFGKEWPLMRLSHTSWAGMAALAVAGALCTACSGSVGSVPTTVPRQSLTLNVPAKDPYTRSGITVAAGQRISITASGKPAWRFDCTGSCRVGPNGISFQTKRCKALQRSKVFGVFTAPGLACFSLIGRIGSHGSPFEVGSSLTFSVPPTASGELYLGFNDNLYSDNSGSFKATVSF